MPEFDLLTAVALLNDVPEQHLLRGQVGTIIEYLGPDIYEVEFSDGDGRTYASLALPSTSLIRLRHEPAREAA